MDIAQKISTDLSVQNRKLQFYLKCSLRSLCRLESYVDLVLYVGSTLPISSISTDTSNVLDAPESSGFGDLLYLD